MSAPIAFSSLVLPTQKEQAVYTAERLVKEALSDREYVINEAQSWANDLAEQVATAMQTLSTAFKYSVTCYIVQKGEGNIHAGFSCFWDPTRDGSFSIKWDNVHLHCVLSVVAIAAN